MDEIKEALEFVIGKLSLKLTGDYSFVFGYPYDEKVKVMKKHRDTLKMFLDDLNCGGVEIVKSPRARDREIKRQLDMILQRAGELGTEQVCRKIDNSEVLEDLRRQYKELKEELKELNEA